jgi:Tol biopolymer transport system component
LATIVAIVAIYLSPNVTPAQTSRFLIEMNEGINVGASPVAPYPSISPDGRYFVFTADAGRGPRLWIRPIDSVSVQELTTENPVTGAASGFYPFWSADSRFVAYFAGGKLKKVSVGGGPPQTITDATGDAQSGTWNQSDIILFHHEGAIHRVSAAGGVSSPVRTPDKATNEIAYRWPDFLPDGNHFVYVAVNSDAGRTEVRLGSLDSPTDTPLFAANSRVLYSEPGYILFVRDGTLMAQPFDTGRLSISGDAFPIAERVGTFLPTGKAAFSVSTTGTLVFRTSSASDTELTWFDRSGKRSGSISPGPFQTAILSPDQNRIAVERRDGGSSDIWLIDLVRGTNSRFTFDPADDLYPVFSPDGDQVVFVSGRSGKNDLYVKPASGVGAEERILEGMDGVSDWSPDGKFLLPAKVAGGNWDIWAFPMTGDRKAYPLINSKFLEYRAKFSPDGRWLLYTSNETGRNEIYVQAFPPSGGKWQISVQGGESGYWRRDGKEIVFVTADRKIMAADVTLGTTFEAGVPRELFQFAGTRIANRIIMTADAQRFLLPLAAVSGERPAITTVLNWAASIK